jgi:hypothetical protein
MSENEVLNGDQLTPQRMYHPQLLLSPHNRGSTLHPLNKSAVFVFFLMLSTVVLEWGSCFIRLGIAGEHAPRLTRVNSYSYRCEANSSGVVELSVQSKVALSHLLSRLLLNDLKVKLRECRLLLVEHILMHSALRCALFEICLNDLQVRCFTFAYALLIRIL